MKKSFFLFFICLFVVSSSLNNKLQAFGIWCWFERYENPRSGLEPDFYGFEDIYNYPYGYALPLNCYFNHRPCPYGWDYNYTEFCPETGVYYSECDNGCCRRFRN